MPSLPREKTTLVSGALFLAVFCLFLPCLRNGVINFDDPVYLLSNPHIQHGLDWRTIQWAFTTGYAANWHPLTWLSHALDWQLFGARAWGHHLVNVLLHAATTATLFIVLQKMTGAMWRSFFVAAIFGVHPLRVESVVWASERKDVLGALFWMLTLWCYAGWVQKSAGGKRGRRIFYTLALGFFALGLMSKPMLVTLPFTLLLLDYWPLGRWEGGADVGKRLVIEKIPFFALALVVCAITWRVQQQGGSPDIGTLRMGPGERIANACVSYVRYPGKFFAPVNLAIIYPLPPGGKWPVAVVLVSAAYLLLLTAVVVAQARRWPYFFTGWFWYLGTLVPVIGFVQVGIQAMADRYTYVPMIGPTLALTWGVCDAARRWRFPGFAVPSIGAVLLAGCAILTLRQITFWKDSETIFRRALAVAPASPLAHLDLGCALAENGNVDEAIRHFQQALELADDLPDAHYNLGVALLGKNDFQGAATHLQAALAEKPSDAETHYYLGRAYKGEGKPGEAIEQYGEALRLAPGYAPAQAALDAAEIQAGMPAP